MPLNLTKTYSQKSNAQADIRKAIKNGECVAGDFTVVALSGGFKIIKHDAAAEAASWQKPRWPEGMTPGMARLRANGGEAIRMAVLAEDEAEMAKVRAAGEQARLTAEYEADRAAADASASIVANSGEELAAILAAQRAAADTAHVELVVSGPVFDKAVDEAVDLIREANARGIEPAQFAEIARRCNDDTAKIWTVLQGCSLIDPAKPAKAAVQRAVNRAIANGAEPVVGIPAAMPATVAKGGPDALSPEAVALLAAVVYSPALRDLEPEAKVGKWIAYKTIHESDRPHGLNRRRVPGFMTTLFRRGLVDCREEKAGQYSACVTAAGVAILAEAGR